MRILGLDIGDRRTGVAISDPNGTFALPLTVIDSGSRGTTIKCIFDLVEEYEITHIVMGLPYSSDASIGQQADKVISFADELSQHLAASPGQRRRNIDIQLWDESFSSISADRLMTEAGTRRSKKKHHRDALAAAVILQEFLNSTRGQAQH